MRIIGIIDVTKKVIAIISWKMFLWASNMTEAEYNFQIVQENSDYP